MNTAEMALHDGAFIPSSVNNHPHFTPIKQAPGKLPKPPKAPEKPLMPYMRYSREIWESVKAAHPDQKLSEIGRIIGRMWRELPLHEKQKFIDDYDGDKVKYAEAFKIYQNSPAYQQYLLAKEKFHAEEREAKVKVCPKPEARITLPACESDEVSMDQLDNFHLRQLAAARYYRNQRLLHEVFNEACVPDMRQVITVPRLVSLKRQVETLTMHHKKIDTEISQLVETFEAKKRRLEDGSREFHVTIEKYRKPAVTPASYDKMVEEAERQLTERYRAYTERQQGGAPASADAVASESTTALPETTDQNSDAPANGKSEPAELPDDKAGSPAQKQSAAGSDDTANGIANGVNGDCKSE